MEATATTATPFGSNLEYLAATLGYVGALASKRLLMRRLEANNVSASVPTDEPDEPFDDDGQADHAASTRRCLQKVMEITRNQAAERLEALNARIAATLAEGRTDLPLERLARDHGLTEFEKLVLVVVLGPELDGGFGRTVESLHRSRSVEVRTVLDILCETLEQKIVARRCFVHSGTLLSHGLLSMSYSHRPGGSESEFMSMDCDVPRRVSSLILGEYDIDDALVTFSSVVEPEVDLSQVVLPPGRKEEILQLVQNRDRYLATRKAWGFDQLLPYGRGTVLLFQGPPGTGKTMLAHALAKETGHRLMLVDIRKIGEHSQASFEENLQRVFREARLHHAIVFMDECDEMLADRGMNAAMPTLLRELEKLDGIAILATNRGVVLDEALQRRVLYHLDFEVPPPELRLQIWRRHLPAQAPVADGLDLKALAEEFDFSGGFIKNAVLIAVHRAMQRPESGRVIGQDDLRAGALAQRRNRLGAHTDKLTPKAGLADVVLPDDTRRQVEAFVAAAKRRSTVFSTWGFGDKQTTGKAVTALFSGGSGVGKSMTAEAVAYELGQNLYPVRLSSVLSAYVGQTERALAEVFKNAAEAGALLFFDEADALFTSRQDASEHGSTYGNQRVNCLLTELEKHDGVVILATNRPEAFDKAFERRIRYRIAFPAPDATERLALWHSMIPAQAPVNGVDFSRLAKDYEFTGGTIRNVLLRAAFEAATNGQVITDAILRRCADDEQPLKKERQAIGFGAKA
jgi:SpoVK/Ycf46/Vps4 family AAA+-type ATPase